MAPGEESEKEDSIDSETSMTGEPPCGLVGDAPPAEPAIGSTADSRSLGSKASSSKSLVRLSDKPISTMNQHARIASYRVEFVKPMLDLVGNSPRTCQRQIQGPSVIKSR